VSESDFQVEAEVVGCLAAGGDEPGIQGRGNIQQRSKEHARMLVTCTLLEEFNRRKPGSSRILAAVNSNAENTTACSHEYHQSVNEQSNCAINHFPAQYGLP
jgi:hypothetical protein